MLTTYYVEFNVGESIEQVVLLADCIDSVSLAEDRLANMVANDLAIDRGEVKLMRISVGQSVDLLALNEESRDSLVRAFDGVPVKDVDTEGPVLSLSKDEANWLADLTKFIRGDCNRSRRRFSVSIEEKLKNAGYPANWKRLEDMSGSIGCEMDDV